MHERDVLQLLLQFRLRQSMHAITAMNYLPFIYFSWSSVLYTVDPLNFTTRYPYVQNQHWLSKMEEENNCSAWMDAFPEDMNAIT